MYALRLKEFGDVVNTGSTDKTIFMAVNFFIANFMGIYIMFS